VEPTCTTAGYTLYSCIFCPLKMTANKVDRILHWFGAWTPNNNSTHNASCMRDGCNHSASIECGKATVVIDEVTYTFCPVCGDMGDNDLIAVEATGKAVKGADPRGDLVVLGGPTEGEDALLAITYEYSGRAENAKTAVNVTLPVDFAECVFLLINADGTETAVETTVTDDGVTFAVDFAECGKVAFLRMVLFEEETK